MECILRPILARAHSPLRPHRDFARRFLIVVSFFYDPHTQGACKFGFSAQGYIDRCKHHPLQGCVHGPKFWRDQLPPSIRPFGGSFGRGPGNENVRVAQWCFGSCIQSPFFVIKPGLSFIKKLTFKSIYLMCLKEKSIKRKKRGVDDFAYASVFCIRFCILHTLLYFAYG